MSSRNEIDDALDEIVLEYSKEEAVLERELKGLELKKASGFLDENQTWIPWKLENIEDVEKLKEMALKRNKTLRKEQMSAQQLDYSFRGITYMPDIKQTRPRNGLKPYKRSPSGRFWCSSFRLNNNNIVTVQGIRDIVNQIFEIPENLTWIDLSFNKLTYIHPEIAELRNLKILYLHGNHFSQFTPVLYHLQALDKLYSLTLHGNPIEEVRGYRQRVLSILPNLKNLDFTNVTNADLECLDQGTGYSFR